MIVDQHTLDVLTTLPTGHLQMCLELRDRPEDVRVNDPWITRIR